MIGMVTTIDQTTSLNSARWKLSLNFAYKCILELAASRNSIPSSGSALFKLNDPIMVALVGVDIDGNAPGGIATISRAIVEGFGSDSDLSITTIVNFDEGSNLRRLLVSIKAVWMIARHFRKIDVVHIQVAIGLSIERDLLIASVSRMLALPVIVQFHGAGQIGDFESGSVFHRLCYRVLIKIAHILTLGPNLKSWILGLDKSASVTVVQNGVPVPEEALPFPDGPAELVFVGRLGQRKGVYDLLDAVELINRKERCFRIKLLGDGDVAKVAERVNDSEFLKDCVSVLGWQDQSAVTDAISGSWALVLPSYAEGLPMAILEAMACARAVVATRVGENDSAVLDQVTGILFEAGDVGGLVNALTRVSCDRSFAKRMGIQAHQEAMERFTTDAFLESLKSVYRRTSLQGSARKRRLYEGDLRHK
jgi:glycosyltransferase involved in cell wall biosynthesis